MPGVARGGETEDVELDMSLLQQRGRVDIKKRSALVKGMRMIVFNGMSRDTRLPGLK